MARDKWAYDAPKAGAESGTGKEGDNIMEAKHTSGPWEVGADPDGLEDCESIWYGEHGTQAEIAGRICEPTNARLIAAAPDMYDALRDAVGILAAVRDTDCTVYVDDLADAIDATIARAEGRG